MRKIFVNVTDEEGALLDRKEMEISEDTRSLAIGEVKPWCLPLPFQTELVIGKGE